MKPIRNMKEALKFAEEFNNGDIWIFPDSKISMPNGGNTEIRKRAGQFYAFSSGLNWRDQQQEIISEIGAYIWKYRVDIRSGEWGR